MKVWVIEVENNGKGVSQVFATKDKAVKRMQEMREEDWESIKENCDDPDAAEEDRENGNFDGWNEFTNREDSLVACGYSYDNGDNWCCVRVRECEVQGLAGRNAL